MKNDSIKKAFACIDSEAGNDSVLSQKILNRAASENNVAPISQLKSLAVFFLIIGLPAIIFYFFLFSVNLPAISLIEPESMVEQNTLMAWQNLDSVINENFIWLWFTRATLRVFLILMALTFILTAAAMPVCRPEIKGGSPCVA